MPDILFSFRFIEVNMIIWSHGIQMGHVPYHHAAAKWHMNASEFDNTEMQIPCVQATHCGLAVNHVEYENHHV